MDSRTWQQPQTRGSVIAEKNTWLLVAAFALLLAGFMVNQSTTAFFTDTRVVSGNNFITASVALNETPFTAFNFEKFVPGDVFVRPVQVTNSTASNSGAINVNYYMTIKDNFSNCNTGQPACTDAKGTLSDTVTGLRLVAIRCFSDVIGTANVACESSSLRSVRLVKGVMETVWPGGSSNATKDIAGIVRDRNETVQYGNVGGTGSEAISAFPGLPNGGDASDYFGRPIVFAKAGALSTQPISVKINPRRSDTNNPAQLGSTTLTNTSNPVVQGSDVLRLGGTVQDLDGNWQKNVGNLPADCGNFKANGTTPAKVSEFTAAQGCGAEVVGVPIQTLSNPNCNGLATAAPNRAVVNATGNQGSQAGPGANATVVSVNQAALAPQVFSTQSQGACFMGGSEFEKNSPIVLSPRINNQLMAAGGGDTPRIVSDIPAQSLFDQVNTIAGLAAGKSDNLALIVYLPSWSTQSTQDEVGATALTVQSRQTLDAQNNPVSVPIGGAGNKTGGKASYTVAFTAVQPVGQTFALANVAQQSVNTLAALAGQIQTNNIAFQAQSSDVGSAGANLITGGIQTVSPNRLPGGGTQVISVTGRGFAKVTGIPQNVKAEAALASGALSAGTVKYIVTAGTAADPSTAKTWDQGEPSTEVAVTAVANGKVTITWNSVASATYYNVFRNVNTSTGAYEKRIKVDVSAASLISVPDPHGFAAGAQFGVVDNGFASDAAAATANGSGATATIYGSETSGKFPAVGRPCAQYASPAFTFGMCPKVEIFPTGPIPATGGTASTDISLKTGEVLSTEAGSGVSSPVAAGTAGTERGVSADAVDGTTSGLLQLDGNKATDWTKSVFASTADTVGFISSNQVTFQASSAVKASLTNYGVRITNPGHPSLPLDVREKVMVLADSISVIPQSVTSYTPARIGRISTGNQLVIKGTGFQKGSIVQLGVHRTTGTSLLKANLVADEAIATSANSFFSKSHIVNRDANTLKTLGTTYASGYRSDLPAGSCALDGVLLSKDCEAIAGTATEADAANQVPWFSFDHNQVEVNNDSQITIKGITMTNVKDAPVGVAAKVFNPDGSVVYAKSFGVAAPGIEQIVQVDSLNNQWLSAAQGQTVKLRFQAALGDTFRNTASGLAPTVKISCYRKALASDAIVIAGNNNVKNIAGAIVTATAGVEYDPCYNVQTGATDVGMTQIGDLKVVTRTASGDAVEGTFQISDTAVESLRKFTMTNGDAAVFSNYFSISQAPTFSKVSYTSGTTRIVSDVVAAPTLASVATVGFNVEGRIPRGAKRRILITGSGFVTGSYGPMVDPLDTAQTALFGARSTQDLVKTGGSGGLALNTNTVTPKIEFSNPGISLVRTSANPASASVWPRSTVWPEGISDLTTVVKDNGTVLDMATTAAQSTDKTVATDYKKTQRMTTVVQISATASAGPVTMTITNPDGGKVIVPNAFIVDGVPTIDVTRNSVITSADATGPDATNGIVTGSNASIKQGEQKVTTNAIAIYGSGFFNAPDGSAPKVQISGSGVRVTSVRLSKIDPVAGGGVAPTPNDTDLMDTVLRVELAAESTAPTGTRDITVVLPDGQSVTKTAALSVGAP